MSDASATSPEAAPLTEALLSWYVEHRRDLPWRRTRDPYAIWVSEVMLQQTQVATVIPYYARFLGRFPTIAALASAPLDEVLSAWQGLGYYARARNLHLAARLMMEMHGGRLPTDPPMLRALPGMGDYVAAAVASIAFGADMVAVDANVARVLCRIHNYADDMRSADGRRTMSVYAEALLPVGNAGEFNQAMMELGATVCQPRTPRCDACPLATRCEANRLGVQGERPFRQARRPLPHRIRVAIAVVRADCLLLVRRRPAGLLGGLWELPGLDALPGEPISDAAQRVLAEALGATGRVGDAVGQVRHAYTHFTEAVHIFRAVLDGDPAPADVWDDWRWLGLAEMRAVGLTGVTVKALKGLGWPPAA